MEEKSNSATELRPEGARTLDASFVLMNYNAFISQLKAEKTWQDSDRNSISIFKNEVATLTIVGLRKDAQMKEHVAPGQIFVQVLEGCIHFAQDGNTHELKRGDIIALKAKIPHSVTALEDSFFLLNMIK